MAAKQPRQSLADRAAAQAPPKKAPARPKGAGNWPRSINTGPTQDIQLQGHDQDQGTIFCASINEGIGEFVTGSADHALRIWDLKTGKSKRELFKNGGHHEWVTTVDYLDNDIISGSMDNQIIRWSKGAAKGVQVGLHSSVAKLITVGKFVVSAGYDGCIQIIDPFRSSTVSSVIVDKRGMCQLIQIPSTEEDVALFATGSRTGVIALISVDVNSGQSDLVWKVAAHKDQIVSLGVCPSYSQDDFVSGGGDGKCVVWRNKEVAWCSPQNKGSITFCAYECGPKGEKPRVTYGTSSGEINIVPLTQKANANMIPVHQVPIVEGVLLDGILLTGDAKGMIIAHRLNPDTATGEATMLWGFGALKMAIRCIVISESRNSIVIGGEEANGMLLKFE